jgi:hypothetical protein
MAKMTSLELALARRDEAVRALWRAYSVLAEVLDEDAWPDEDLDLYSAATGHRAVQERLTTKPKEA